MADKDRAMEVFGPGGELEGKLPYFKPRQQQIDLVRAVVRALSKEKSAVLEAGTGTGKTYAYLAPILLSGKKAVISTSTKGLQDQLLNQDLPELMKALNLKVSTCVLKGRANYICKHRLEKVRKGGLDLSIVKAKQQDAQDELSKIEAYLENTKDGDRAGIRGVAPQSRIWPLVTSTSANCERRECSYYSECFVYQARERARKCQLVVANHALMFSDASNRMETGDRGMILPGKEVVVFDEAHSLPDDLSNHFGKLVSVREVASMAHEAFNQCHVSFPHRTDAGNALNVVKDVCARLIAHVMDSVPAVTMSVKDFRDEDKIVELVDSMRVALAELSELRLDEEAGEGGEVGEEMKRLVEALEDAHTFMSSWPDEDASKVNWIEFEKSTVKFWKAPLETASLFREHFIEKIPCLLLSATMSYKGDLTNYKQRVGADKADDLVVDSPFDYPNISMLLLPPGMPNPNHTKPFSNAIAKLAVPLVVSNQGKAFLLFSSWAVLKEVHKLIEPELRNVCKVLVQGEASPTRLLERFREDGAVLLGTRTYWQGVDVRGDALSLVLVDKIPFVPPDDPLVEAQSKQLGVDGFLDVQLPRATQILKQGAGRLIRGETDRGVLVICDPRMTEKPYGATIAKNLPPMKRTTDPKAAAAFLEKNQ